MPSGWLLKFECEKFYGPSWDLKIVSAGDGAEYSLWILMEVFKSYNGKFYGPATMENQVAFMAAESESIFSNVELYSARYEEVNRSW